MRKIALALALCALAFTAFIQPTAQASAAPAAPTATVTLTDSTPTYKTPWGLDVHKVTITVARGTVVNVELLGQILPGYKWDVTAVEILRDCNGAPDQATGNDFRCFEDSPSAVSLSADGTKYQADITAPSVTTTIRVDYGYFPPLKPGQTGNTAIKVFEAEVIVQ